MASVAVEQPASVLSGNPPDDETFDVTIQKLKLAGALQKAGLDVDVTKVITDGSTEDSTTGAPMFTVSILDRDLAALKSGVFGQKVEVTLDGIPYRLVDVGITDVDALELQFEHKLVNLLREHKGPLKAARSSMTRAQFVEVMLREISKEFPVRYVCPEENVIQPVQKSAKSSGRSLTAKTLGGTVIRNVRGSGFGLSALDIRYWDGSTVTLGPTQLKNAATVLQVCNQLGLKPTSKATVAVMAACIVEPNKPFENTKPNPLGAGILSWAGGQPWANDVVQSVQHALQDPGATGRGGMISLAANNPGWTPGQVAQAEQGSAFPTRYDQAVPGAQTVISAFTSAGGYAATGVNFGSAAGSTYEFSRGQPGQPEDSWTCILRLAREVNWRAFVSGRNSFYFVNDDDLLKSAAIYNITPTTRGVEKLTGNAEVGGRTVRKHRHRQPKPSEAQLTVRIDRWKAPPGAVLLLDGWGPFDGRWLAIDTQRPLFDHQATVSLQSPQAPFAEPAGSSSASASSVGAIAAGPIVAGAVGGNTLLSSRSTVPGHPELKPKISIIVNTVLERWPQLVITSTISGTHASGSYHYLGEAADIAGPNMDQAAAWIAANLTSVLTEGIHNPNLSVKFGRTVGASYWGAATWAQHLNHIHLAAAQ